MDDSVKARVLRVHFKGGKRVKSGCGKELDSPSRFWDKRNVGNEAYGSSKPREHKRHQFGQPGCNHSCFYEASRFSALSKTKSLKTQAMSNLGWADQCATAAKKLK